MGKIRIVMGSASYEVWLPPDFDANNPHDIKDVLRCIYCYHIGDDLYLANLDKCNETITHQYDSPQKSNHIVRVARHSSHPAFENDIWDGESRLMVT